MQGRLANAKIQHENDGGICSGERLYIFVSRFQHARKQRLNIMSSEQGTGSTVSSAAPSPQPLHNPSQAAVIQPPQAPLGGSKPGATVVGGGYKALLAKKMAKSRYAYALPSFLGL